MVTPRDDQLVEKLWPDFVGRNEGIPIWKLAELGNFFDPDDLLLTLRFDDHRLLNPGTLGNYFIGTRGEHILNGPANGAATNRGSMMLVPSLWPSLPALKTNPSVTNIWTNSTLEIGTAGWTWGANAQGGGWGRVLEDSVYGGYCGKAVCSGVGTRFVNTGTFTRGANDDITIACWVRSTTGTSQIQLRLWNSAFGADFVQTTFNIGPTWTRISLTVPDATMDAWAGGGLTLYAYLINDLDGGTNKTWLFDAMDVFALAYDPGHVDGDLGDGYSWASTRHASQASQIGNYLIADGFADQLSGNDTATVAMWVQIPFDHDGPAPAISYLFNIFDGTNNNRLTAWLSSSGVATTVSMYSNNTFLLVETVTFEAGEWVFIVTTWDYANDEYSVYWNGLLLNTATNTLAAPTGLTTFRIGAYLTTIQGGLAFAEFLVVDRVLSIVEVANWFSLRRPVIDAGAIDKQLPCGVVVYKAANQAGGGAGVWTNVLIDSVEYNEHMVFDPSSALVRITQPGWYSLSGRIQFDPPGAGAFYSVAIQINGATYVAVETREQGTLNVVSPTATTMRMRYLVPGDYVRLLARCSVGGITLLAGAAYSLYLEVVKVRNVFEQRY